MESPFTQKHIMIRIYTLLAFALLSFSAFSQDMALAPPSGSITSPVSGCALDSTENVTVRIFNFGPGTVTSPFNVSYSINGGPAVTEVVAAPNIPANTSFNYTFATTANLSVPGSYSFDATVTLAGDPTPGNNTFSGYVVNSLAASVGGSVSGPASVCETGNSGTLNLSGQTGSVLNWEYSTDGGSTWINISNTTTAQNYNNLSVPTMYRAIVQNASCPAATSDSLAIAIDVASVGGTVGPNATVCSGSNSGTLTLSGRTGTVLNWEFSTDAGVTWTPIANTATTQTYSNLTLTTRYRAIVQNGSCASATSSAAIITVSPNTVGGSITPSTTTVCSGSNSGTLTLSGHTGSILRWEFSTNGGVSWTNVANTTTGLSFSNLTSTRIYRALVKSGACPNAYSSTATITVIPATTAGTLGTAATVCSGVNQDTLNLTGNVGTILGWEFSTDGGSTWTPIANTTNSEVYSNLTVTTAYRVQVQNGSCPAKFSNIVTITVNDTSFGGVITGADTVCSGSNSGTLILSGHTGTIQGWEFSTDSGATWTSIGNSTTTQTFNNLTTSTIYHAIVVSGVCPADTSSDAEVIVNPFTVGGTVNSSDTVCFGINSDTLTLTGQVGTVQQWELSSDNGLTWSVIANTTTSQVYTNLTTPTLFRALVQSEGCAPAYSGTALISINPVSVGGTLYGSTTVCSNSNSGTITLIGNTGSIVNWEASTDNGATWSTIANTSTTENYVNLVDTTVYRALVQNGICPIDTSSTVTVFVDANSVGGIVTSSDTVCAGSNSGSVSVSGQVGSVVGWEQSTDNGLTWFNISNTTASQSYSNLTASTMYRAVVKNGVCNAVSSSAVTISVNPAPVGGIISGATTVCGGTNSGLLSLSDYTGNISMWLSSDDNGVTWDTIPNSTDTLSYFNLTDTTTYLAVLSSGVCPNDTSAETTILVDLPTVAGTLSGSDTVCAASNSGVIMLSGYTGSIIGWEFSTNAGSSWIPLTNVTDSVSYNDLSESIWYRVTVKSGVCNAVYSDTASIIVDAVSEGGTVSGNATGCEGISGSVILSNQTGSVLTWESSTDAGATWAPIANTSSTLNYTNLADTTWFHAIVQSGICPADTSTSATITVYPKPVASFTTSNVCEGSTTFFTNTSTISAGNILFNLWNFGEGNVSINPSPVHTYADTGSYQVVLTVTSNFNCSDSDTLNVTVFALPIATITSTNSLEFCSGDSTSLSAPSGMNYAYLWNTGDSVQTITVGSAGTYTVTVSDTITGCFRSDSVTIVVFALPTASAGSDTTINLGSTITLNGSGGLSYSWTPAIDLNNAFTQSPQATPAGTTTYTLTVTDINGCTDTDSVLITVVPNFDFMVSNLITPNGDGFNDTWYIENIELYTQNEVSVLNRNGQVVFSASGYDNSWTGTYGGADLPDGTYYYVIRFTDTEQVIQGAVTIVRNQ